MMSLTDIFFIALLMFRAYTNLYWKTQKVTQKRSYRDEKKHGKMRITSNSIQKVLFLRVKTILR